MAITLPWQPRPQLDSALLPSYKLATGLTGRILSHYMARLLLMLIKLYILTSRHSCISIFSLHFFQLENTDQWYDPQNVPARDPQDLPLDQDQGQDLCPQVRLIGIFASSYTLR